MKKSIKDSILYSFQGLDAEFKESTFENDVKKTNDYLHLIGKKRAELTLEDLDAEYDLSLQVVFNSKAIAYYLPSILINLVDRYCDIERHSFLNLFVPPVNNMGEVRKTWLSGFVSFLTDDEKACTATVLKYISEEYGVYLARDALDRYWNAYLK